MSPFAVKSEAQWAADLPVRFWAKVDKGESDECWEWTAYRLWNGYGRFGYRHGDVRYAHRVAYELAVGPIPDGLDIDHLCRNRACVNPAHLEPVTRSVNLRRGDTIVAERAAKTHCPRGHEYTEANTIRSKQGWRSCRECNNARQRAAWHRKKAVA